MLTPERYRRLTALFHEACSLSPARRAEFVRTACRDDVAMRLDLERMLEHEEHPIALDAIETPASGEPWSQEGSEPHERWIAHYRILDTLGQGAMGVVYRAEQRRPRREVAIKVLRAGLLGTERLRRLRHESEILSRLSHPGIATIFEAGAAVMRSGPDASAPPIDRDALELPYFAMELVPGVPLDAHCHAGRLGTRDRLLLMARICDAVDHAHRRGVVHRDLKPANILVVAEDDPAPAGPGAPKILDFGVARVTDPRVQAETMSTGAGDLIGTLAYMSPEQLDGRAAMVDARSDVHALGVILYELLSGRLPYPIAERGLAAVSRTIVESSPTPLRTSDDARVARDIEAIVLTALAKEPSRRYQSAAALAADLRRHLAHEPVTARAPSALYLAGRLVRRHRGLAGGLALAFAILVTALVLTGLQRIRIAREATLAREVNDFLETILIAADPYPLHRGMVVPRHFGVDVRLIDILDDAIARLDAQPMRSPEAEATIRYRLGLSCYGFGRYRQGVAMLERAVELRRRIHGPDDLRTLECQVGLVWHRTMLLDSLNAEELAERTVEAHVRTVGWDRLETVRALGALAISRLYLEDFSGAVATAEQMRTIAERVPELGFTSALPRLLIADLNVRQLDRVDEGEAMARSILAEFADGPEFRTNVPGYARLILGRAARARDDLEEAERLLAEGIEIWSGVARTQALSEFRGELASVIARQPGRLHEGLLRWTEIIEAHRSEYGDDAPVAFLLRRSLADELLRAGDHARAAELLSACVTEWLESGRYATLPRHAELLCALGRIQRERGRLSESRHALERGLAVAAQFSDALWRRVEFDPGELRAELATLEASSEQAATNAP